MSCSIAQRLVCLACIVSWSATPKQRRIARRSSDPAAIAAREPSSASESRYTVREWISMCPGSDSPGPISAHTGYSR